jgi:phospholipid transport system substrate-binding protein
MKRLLAPLLLVCLGAAPTMAAVSEAAAPIAALDSALVGAMQAGKATPFVQRYDMLAPAVQHAFDLDTILEVSVGPRWQSFTPEQKQELRTEFLRFTVASYVSNFSAYDGERFDLDPDPRPVGAEQVISTHIVPKTGSSARIDYVMRQTDAGWRAVDVLLDGSISRVAVQRSDFRSQLEGGPDALIEGLRKKVGVLAGGASLP